MSNTKYMYVPSELAAVLEQHLNDQGAMDAAILEYCAHIRADLKISIESIDEDVLLFRASMIKARESFKQAKDEQLKAMYELWESYEPELNKIHAKVKEYTAAIRPVKAEIDELSRSLKNLQTYDIEKFVGAIRSVEGLSPQAKELLTIALGTFNKQ